MSCFNSLDASKGNAFKISGLGNFQILDSPLAVKTTLSAQYIPYCGLKNLWLHNYLIFKSNSIYAETPKLRVLPPEKYNFVQTVRILVFTRQSDVVSMPNPESPKQMDFKTD